MTFKALVRQPAAFVPVAMAGLGVAMIAAQLIRFGAAPQPDETGYARIWQLLMLMEVPAIAVFAVRWLPVAGRSAQLMLGLQLASVAVAVAPIALLGW
jgi:hypothetical protein